MLWYYFIEALAIPAIVFTLFVYPINLSWEDAPGVLLLFILTAFGAATPIEIAPKTKTGVGVPAIFASILLFGPAVGVINALAATSLAFAFRRFGSLKSQFASVACIGLSAAVAGITVAFVAGTPLVADAGHRAIPASILGAIAMYLVNTIPVAIAADLQLKRPLMRSYFSDQRERALQHGSLFALGLLGAMASMLEIGKPWAMLLVLLPIGVVLRSLQSMARLRKQTWEAIELMADMVDLRERYTAQHSKRVEHYALDLCRSLKLTRIETDLITQAARVHDVGKLGMSGAILSEARPLTDEEWVEMKQHPVIGARIVGRLSEFQEGAKIVLHHHERWDGRGYPHGLAADQIPLGARIVAVADTFDAMTSDRPYRKGLPVETALEEIDRCRGTQFDPRVAEAFLRSRDYEPGTAPPKDVPTKLPERTKKPEPVAA